jgi:LDH2 family malate/lactate/ureidoglycolate dehydrogenase
MASIIQFPRINPNVVIERERDTDAWLVIAWAHGWAHGSFDAALRDARELAAGFGVAVVSSAGRSA